MLRSVRFPIAFVLSLSLLVSPILALPVTRTNFLLPISKPLPVPVIKAAHRAAEVLVKFKDSAPETMREQVRLNYSGEFAQRVANDAQMERLMLKPGMDVAQALAELNQLHAVIDWVEPNYLVKTETTTRGKKERNVATAPKRRVTMSANASPMVAVIDTGIAATHPNLRSRLAEGWNVMTDTATVNDDNGHGTQMAGIIAQVNPNARLLPLKALDGDGIGTISAVVAAMDRAVAQHAQVILYSFGTDGDSKALREAINRAEKAGVVVVTAAGNDGQDLAKSPQYPAAFNEQNLLTVAAVNAQQQLADFSNYGTAAQVAAPGVEVRTTNRPNAFTTISGTSASAAYVAGVASRLKGVRLWVSASTVKQSIMQGARKLPALEGKVSAGLVDMKAALKALQDPKPTAQEEPKKEKIPLNKKLEERKKNFQTRKAAKEITNTDMPNSMPYDLNVTRQNRPALPEGRVKANARQGAGYDDPVPTSTANFVSYFTQLSQAKNDTGIAGSKPMQQVDPTIGVSAIGGFSHNLLSKNLNFTAPVLSLAGRAGLNLGLGLTYNSNVWTKNPGTNTMFYNAERGFPAPGWRFGFGAIQGINTSGNIGPYTNTITGKASFLYIQPDGTKRDLAYNTTTSKYESYDSSYLDFDATTKILRTASGTQITFGTSATASSDYQFLPTQIKDRNGNFITIVYKQLSNNDTVMDYVIDTLGRRIDFFYQNNRLTEIRQDRNGTIFKYAIIDYTPVTLNASFSSVPNLDVSGTTVYVPSRITYPTGVNLRLYYTSYGQVHLVEKWVPTISGQGSERRIAFSKFGLYSVGSVSYPANSTWSNLSGLGVTDASPAFSNRYEAAENWIGGTLGNSSLSTSFSYGYSNGDYSCSNCPTATVTEPPLAGTNNQTVHTIRNTTDPKQIYTITGPGYDQWGYPTTVQFKNITTTYTSDSGVSYLSNLRPTQSTITDQSNQSRKVGLSYLQQDGMWLVQHKDDYAANGTTVYRRTTMSYTSYPAQRILGLPLITSVYAGAGTTLMAKTENVYDQTATWQDSNNQPINHFINAGATVQHDDTNYGSGFVARGNVTSVKQYATDGTTNRITARSSYDTNGNVRHIGDAAGNRQSIDLTDNFINKPGGLGALQAYPYFTANPIGMKAGAQYNYYTGQAIKTFAMRPNQSTEEQVTTTTYDFADRPLRTTSPTGSYVELGYWDNILRQTTYTKRDVVGGVDQLVYSWQDFNGAGLVLRKGSDHPNGGAGKFSGQKFNYDNLGRGFEQSNVLAITSSFVIDTTEPGQSYAGWKMTAAEFDGLGRTTAVEKPDNTYIFTDYNVCGCAGGLVTDNYDERNNLRTTKNDFLGRLQYARELEPYMDYDTNGQPYIADYTIRAEVEYQYDALDRITNIIHRGNGSVMASSGNSLTGTGQTRSFAYDLWGRAQSETTPEAGTTSYTYTTNDQIATTTDANNKVTTVAYNNRNLVTGISYNDGTPSVSYGYDDYGARTSMTDGEGAMNYTYNTNRQLTSETRTFTGLGSNNYTFNYSYNLGGQLTQANYVAPSFTKNINYAYNSKGALNGIGTNLIGSDPTTTTNVISGMVYRAFGAASSISYGNNRTATLSYNLDLMRMTTMQVARPDGTDKIVDNYYWYTDNGLISGVSNSVDSAYGWGYSYNYRNQLKQSSRVVSPGTDIISYGVDDWGNFTGTSTNANATTSFSYAKISGTQVPATNRISSMTVNNGTPTNFTYDNAGNMTAAGSTTYQWDAANRLNSVNNGSLGSYGYDGNGKRVKKSESGTTTYYVISSVLGSAMEVTSVGVQRAYVMSGGSVVAQLNPNGQFYWLHLDHLGSGRKMTDSAGNMTYRAEFDPYGKLLYEWSSPTNLNTRKFTGYERDAATNLDYAQARMYASDWGRFMSPDPIGIRSARLTSPKTLNLYSYVHGDPVNMIDPSGLDPLSDWLRQLLATKGGIGKPCTPGSVCVATTGYAYSSNAISLAESRLASMWQAAQGQRPVVLPTPIPPLPPITVFGPNGDPSITLKLDFKRFLENGLSSDCSNMIGPWLNDLKNALDPVQIYNLNIIGNDPAKDYVGLELVLRTNGADANTTLVDFFRLRNSAAVNGGATTVTNAPRSGIYNQGGAQNFLNDPYFFLHEMMHYIGLSDKDLVDKMLIRKRLDENDSDAVSRWFNNKCSEVENS